MTLHIQSSTPKLVWLPQFGLSLTTAGKVRVNRLPSLKSDLLSGLTEKDGTPTNQGVGKIEVCEN